MKKKTIALIHPAEEYLKVKTLGELKDLLASLPRLGDEAKHLEKDLKEILKHQPTMPNGNLCYKKITP